MAELEQTAVFTINLDPEGHLRLLEPKLDPDLALARWLPTQMIAFPGEPDRRCDTVAELLSQSDSQAPWAYILEVEARPRSRFLDRLFEYQARASRKLRHGPRKRDRYLIACGVIVLTGRLKPTPMKMKLPNTNLGLFWRARVFNLSRRSARKMLDRIASGELSRALLPWVPLMRGGDDPEVVARWLEIAREEPNAQRRMDYANLAKVFAERAGCLAVWEKALEGWEMWKSTVIEAWRKEGHDAGHKEGRIEGKRDTLVEMVQMRYPSLAPELLERIKASTDANAIQRWCLAFVTAADQAAFVAALGNGASDDKPPA